MPYDADTPLYRTLESALSACNNETLSGMLQLTPTKERATRKAEIVSLILRELAGDGLVAQWHELDDLQQMAVSEALYAPDGRFDRVRFGAKYGAQPSWGTREGYRDKPSRLALFIHGGSIPMDLVDRLRAFVPEPEATALKTTKQPPHSLTRRDEWVDYQTRERHVTEEQVPITRWEMERAAAQDLFAVLRLVSMGKIAVSDKTGYPTAGAMKQIAEVLQAGDFYAPVGDGDEEQGEAAGPIRAFAWPMLLQAGKLAQASGKRLALTSAGQKAMGAPAAETLRGLWRSWLRSTLLDELRRINAIRGQTGKGKYGLTALSGRRAACANILASCPEGAWVAVDDLFRYVRAADLDFEVTRNAWTLYISSPQYGALEGAGNIWPILQGRYLLCLIMEYAATLGIVDVTCIPPAEARQDYESLWGTDDLEFLSRYDGLLYLRLTGLGAYCLGKTGTYSAPAWQAEEVLRVMPNLEVAAIGAVAPSDALMLGIYADKTADVVWKLDAFRILEAIEQGHSVVDLKEFLASRSANDLPATVLRFLDDLAGRAARLHDRGTAHLIECADHPLAVLITHDSRTRPFCFLAGDRHLVVPIESEAQFRRALRQVGYVISGKPSTGASRGSPGTPAQAEDAGD
jgi:hypothetical protein